jgi:hypothetical protein
MITQVYWKPLAELLNPKGSVKQNLDGFDDEFVDIVDYIIRITYRIWEQKNIGQCYDYYSEYCPVHTLGGYSDSVETVVQNTLKTIAAFPDRSLIGENVVWSQEQDNSYYSSHRITSIMTNKAPSEFGPATGQTGRVTTIADCICKENKIVYEWLVRDNSFLVKQLGIEPIEAAKYQAQSPVNAEFTRWINDEYQRVRQGQSELSSCPPGIDSNAFDLANNWVEQLFNLKNFKQLADFYHLMANIQWPGGRRATGLSGICGVFSDFLASCPDALATLDHIAVCPFSDDETDVAIRWSLAGTFNSRKDNLQVYSGQPFFILAATHLRISKGKIKQEWTVFDEVSAIANLIRKLPNLQVK